MNAGKPPSATKRPRIAATRCLFTVQPSPRRTGYRLAGNRSGASRPRSSRFAPEVRHWVAAAELRQRRHLVFLRGKNLADEEARRSTSFLAAFAPLPGRSLEAGVRLEF